ncbi:MAG: hypothetical protein RLZZ165_1307 [Bacteroidota bacterium]|jgi:hypothetical protein
MKPSSQLFAGLACVLLLNSVEGQGTVGLTHYGAENRDGYVLFSPMVSTSTYLIDKCGEEVHGWSSSTYKPALSAFLLEDGSLLRTGQLNNPTFDEGGSGGIIERFDWHGNLLWHYTLSDTSQCMHHDIAPLPNGNILCIVWDRRSRQEAILNGKDSSYTQSHLWSEKVVELQPVGQDAAVLVWEWRLWDHLVQHFDSSRLNHAIVADHPELVNINYFPGMANTPDWIHLNAIDYHPGLDQILLSSHTMGEVWIIDHSTTTAEAATHAGGNSGRGGDLLYRWGNPQAYQRGNPTTKVFFGQHHATWIPQGYPNAGKILVFNNGLNRPGTYSSIDMVEPPLNLSNTYDVPASTAFLPAALHWRYTADNPPDFYSSNISGVYPLRNGSFMVTTGTQGQFFEIDSSGQTQWSYVSPVTNAGILFQGSAPTNNLVFRCNFYEPDYPGLTGQALTPLGEIELQPTVPSICDTLASSVANELSPAGVVVYPNPFSEAISLKGITTDAQDLLILHDSFGHRVFQAYITHGMSLQTAHLAAGIYFYELRRNDGGILSGKIVKR